MLHCYVTFDYSITTTKAAEKNVNLNHIQKGKVAFQVKFSRFSKGKCPTTEATGISAVFILSFYFQQFETNIWNCGVSVRKYCIFGKKNTNISLSWVLRLEKKETEESKTGEDLHGLLLSKL